MSDAFVLLEDGKPTAQARGDLLVPWWSFGKTVIAATALRLVEQGRLSLDQGRDGVTLRRLLTHEAGLRDYGGLPDYHRAVAAGATPWSRTEMRGRAKAERSIFAPGEAWAYSNIGYLTARERIEQAFGAGLGEAARDLVFAPLDVEGVELALTTDDLDGVRVGTAQGYHPAWVYHGLFVGPLTAAAEVLDGLLGPSSPLSQASQDLMTRRRELPEHNRPPWALAAYGLGFMCPTTAQGWVAVGHTGGGPGSVVAVYSRPEGGRRTAAAFSLGEDQSPTEHRVVELLAVGAS
ncbi:MAG: serine hydrolase domain-containing protein [Phenylobacterium sp.]|uniref:serine hydrolase domain-containing protein n=1 Tax=Phenylobacterium sp. TaxID=1871053 RepID=UPI002736873C|nr:serine hydrolase domain-containing protein [Phenylobacterium sp.]MDP3749900.1 serine hydrolase domain-containing protein [Phenylobacterium sp.]